MKCLDNCSNCIKDNGKDICKMDTNAREWWTQYKPILFEILKVENKVKSFPLM